MNLDQLKAETEAAQSLVELFAQARKCQELYERARMALPEPLKRLMGLDSQPHHFASRVSAHVPPPDAKRPQEAEMDWIYVSLRECTPTSLIPSVLRAAREPLRAREAIDRVLELNPELSKGSIYNTATRLQKLKIIERDGDGFWRLAKPEFSGVIHDGLLWGDKSIFMHYELAAHRRDAILHILKHFEMGLELLQLVEQLRNCSWVKAPANKDLLKADIEFLEENRKIRRRGNTRKWELMPPEKGEENSKAE